MNRASLYYVLTLFFLGAGLWVILRAGASLRAPIDISGVWIVEPPNADFAVSPAQAPRSEEIRIEQSGRFIRLVLETGQTIAGKAVAPPPQRPGGKDAILLLEPEHGSNRQIEIVAVGADRIVLRGLDSERPTLVAHRADTRRKAANNKQPPPGT